MVHQILTNCISIHQPEGQLLGTSLDLVGSLMNHSCDPNVLIVFEGRSLHVRSIRPLSAGDEITQCYTDVGMDVLIRQKALRSDFFFECRCESVRITCRIKDLTPAGQRCETQLQAHEERLPGKRDQLEQSQHQLIELINDAVQHVNVDGIETGIRVIAERAFPHGDWPVDLEPLPTLRTRLATLLWTLGRVINALREGFKGCMLLNRRIGDTWVHHLFDLVQLLSVVLTLPKHSIEVRESGLPAREKMWDLLYGYLRELVRSAVTTFGSDTAYTKAIQGWYDQCLNDDDRLRPETSAFRKRYKMAQSGLLVWAGVDESKGVTLTR